MRPVWLPRFQLRKLLAAPRAPRPRLLPKILRARGQIAKAVAATAVAA